MKRVFFVLVFSFLVSSFCRAQDSLLIEQMLSDSSLADESDTAQTLWQQGKAYSRQIIRLADNSHGFMYYEDDNDSLPFSLDADSVAREEYFRTFREHIDSNELKAHKIVWQLPELLRDQVNEGRLYSIATEIRSTPDGGNPWYEIAVKHFVLLHDDLDHSIPMLRVNIKTKAIQVMALDMSDYMELKEWRKKWGYVKH